MERQERRRKASSRGSSVVETQKEAGKKPVKLVLKSSAPNLPPEKKVRVASPLSDCLTLETPEAVLERLLRIEEADVWQLSLEVGHSVASLQELWRVFRGEEPVCAVIVRVFLEVVMAAGKGEEEVAGVREFALSITKHESHTVKMLGIAALLPIAQIYPELVPAALETAQKEIHCIHHAVRVECLNLIGQLNHVTSNSEFLLAILEEYCDDSDPRVREAALEALLLKHKCGTKLRQAVYHKASEALRDDDEDVRTMALQLVWTLGLQTPDSLLPMPHNPSLEVRMCDDAFAKICDLVNDLAMPVRARAAQLLGDFHSVSPHLLDQTLDKKLMAHLKEVKSGHERQKEYHAAGGRGSGWDSGSTWGAAIPKLDLDPGERSLMSAGACGAFVHGLEDEYLEVRSAAVNSMCQLGIHCPAFATQCVDFLVDMFNDEIQSVRLGAINSLRQVSATLQLREDQMETVLSVLEESSAEIREALHSLLSSCQITTIPALRSTIHALLDNLKKYPSDRQSIWRCLQQLGSNHSALVSCLVPELLNSHPFLMGKEPDMEDPAYICILILVFNAAAVCPTLPPLFPSHVFRHYTYLRDALPNLIPTIKVGMPSSCAWILGHPRKQTDHGIAHTFLQQVLCRAQNVLPSPSPSCSLSPSSSPSSPSSSSSISSSNAHRQEVLVTCISDLLRVGNLDNQLADRAYCAATFLQCQLLTEQVNEALSQDLLLSSSEVHLGPGHTLQAIQELLLLSYRLQNVYQGLGAGLEGGARGARVITHAMLLLFSMQLDLDTEQSAQFMEMKQAFQHRVKQLISYFKHHELPLPAAIKQLADIDFITIATDSLTQCLQPLVTSPLFTSLTPRSLAPVRMCRAVIHEPQPSSRDDYTRFVSSLAISVPVQATLHNVPTQDNVRLQVKFPDGRRLLFPPKSCDFRPLGLHEVKLDTRVIISHGLWTDPCQVELCVALHFPTDLPESSCLALNTPHLQPNTSDLPSLSHSHSNRVHSHSEDCLEQDHSILAISDVIKINIFPQETASRSFNVFGGP